jgi:hypothetical protein
MLDLRLTNQGQELECRQSSVLKVENEDGSPFACVRKIVDRLGEREDFGLLVRICEERWRVAR